MNRDMEILIEKGRVRDREIIDAFSKHKTEVKRKTNYKKFLELEKTLDIL